MTSLLRVNPADLTSCAGIPQNCSSTQSVHHVVSSMDKNNVGAYILLEFMPTAFLTNTVVTLTSPSCTLPSGQGILLTVTSRGERQSIIYLLEEQNLGTHSLAKRYRVLLVAISDCICRCVVTHEPFAILYKPLLA